MQNPRDGRKTQRLRDPVHGLIAFPGDDDLAQLVWRLLNAREFQRLRRIRQLGFSEFVFPGATHTRFAHSVGVFHTARQLATVLKRQLGEKYDDERARVAVCAALLHDLGHGPFSHTFEGVMRQRGASKKHEKWTVEVIRGGTEINQVLREHDASLIEPVAELLEAEQPADIYASIVSSQFDADRLDYLRRDKLMTGTEQGGFDWAWLLDCLEIERLTIGGDGGDDPDEVDGLILGAKGLQAAEGYLLGRFHLYTQVYMHKTTRAAEKMLGALLGRVADLVADGHLGAAGLPEAHPLVAFIRSGYKDLDCYLELDDAAVWAALPQMARATDGAVAELAARLRDRRLYKCLDVGARATFPGGDARARFRRLLKQAIDAGELEHQVDVLEDRQKASAYKIHDYESKEALEKIVIRRADGSGRYDDVAELSPVIKAIGERELFRVYARDECVMERIEWVWQEASR